MRAICDDRLEQTVEASPCCRNAWWNGRVGETGISLRAHRLCRTAGCAPWSLPQMSLRLRRQSEVQSDVQWRLHVRGLRTFGASFCENTEMMPKITICITDGKRTSVIVMPDPRSTCPSAAAPSVFFLRQLCRCDGVLFARYVPETKELTSRFGKLALSDDGWSGCDDRDCRKTWISARAKA